MKGGASAARPLGGRAILRNWGAPAAAFCVSAAAMGVTTHQIDPAAIAARGAVLLPGPKRALKQALAQSDDTAVADIYRQRGYQPLWTDAQGIDATGKALLIILRGATADGLDPRRYAVPARLEGGEDAAASRARLDLALTHAFLAYVRDLHRPAAADAMAYADPALSPDREWHRVAGLLGSRPSPIPALGEALRMHPLYRTLRASLAATRSAAAPDAKREALLLANMDRLRALPADPGARYILVDTASAQLWMIDHGRPAGSMRVVVGKQRLPTPALAGVMRYAVRNPYWNVPPDLVRERGRRALAQGPGFLAAERIELLSSWAESAQVLPPAEVDWRAVADGQQDLRMRQLPGAGNMMGSIKFALPNPLGIYLHDTPDKDLFRGSDRRRSSGCVRVEDADRLARWLFDGRVPPATGASEQRIELPAAVPVFIIYLTALPVDGTIAIYPDSYRRDPAVPVRRRTV